jgi:enoyl-CoA hydratase
MFEPHDIAPVLIKRSRQTMSIVLNRPEVLNSLDLSMVRLIRKGLREAAEDPLVRKVLFYGSGSWGFCAGGDVKRLAELVRKGRTSDALRFLEEEYEMDLAVHRFPKPVVVLADGITMGGGLGISAGADIVLATERTRSAMPETRIGFFPDVGATGWMFAKCPPGYPEYLSLTGYEMQGPECVRVGFATHLVHSKDLGDVTRLLEEDEMDLPAERSRGAEEIASILRPFLQGDAPSKPAMDEWVRAYFAGRVEIPSVLTDLHACSIFSDLCEGVFQGLSERSEEHTSELQSPCR